MGEERKCSALPRVDFPAAALAEASAGTGEPKKIRLRLFCLGASNLIPNSRLLSLSILVSINFPLQSRELLHDRIHITVNSLGNSQFDVLGKILPSGPCLILVNIN